jgi:hypothetical protein
MNILEFQRNTSSSCRLVLHVFINYLPLYKIQSIFFSIFFFFFATAFSSIFKDFAIILIDLLRFYSDFFFLLLHRHHILMCLVILYLKTSLAQFKVISGSSRRQLTLSSDYPSASSSTQQQKSMRTRSLNAPIANSNVTYVQMKPMLSVNTYDISEEVRPRGFSNNHFGKNEKIAHKHMESKQYTMFKRRPSKQSKVIKLNILDSTSPIRQSRIRITKKRVGKLQESALRINNELLASSSGKNCEYGNIKN